MKLCSATQEVREGYESERATPAHASPGSIFAAGFALGRFLKTAGRPLSGTFEMPLSGPNRKSHFYVDGRLTFVVIWDSASQPIIFERAA